MGRSGVTDTTSLLNSGEGHLTFVRERVSSFLRLSKRQTALLLLPRKGMARTCCCGSRCFLPQPEGVWVSTTEILMILGITFPLSRMSYCFWVGCSFLRMQSLRASHDHGAGPLVGEEFAQQDVRLASIHDMHARDGGEGVEAGGDFGYHAAANDAVCYELFGLSSGQFGDQRTVLAADAYDVAQEDQLFGV